MSTAFSALKPPRIQEGSPEWRAALFGQAVAYAVHLTGPICPYALGAHLRTFLGRSEDGCEGEVLDAVLMLIQTGLFTLNTMRADTGVIAFTDESRLTVSPLMTAYLYGEATP
ncbi:hypothetical protein [Methylobacterium sp. Leaf108]|uniref:hypothetical protein n=1 Tax=Methylobacterium sp. Leaf108 TaxID=1736256 RepID=UPI000700AD2D|nr:hypothetical protein [Methylobacterium sp. Leaf108]KQP61075.1 hypothetical protein ASF39_15500 [Methylobacterium sp. Leaf108]